ncbi:MAG: hypothetical protein ACYDEC_17285, partial [Bacteroidia bacterium]
LLIPYAILANFIANFSFPNAKIQKVNIILYDIYHVFTKDINNFLRSPLKTKKLIHASTQKSKEPSFRRASMLIPPVYHKQKAPHNAGLSIIPLFIP